MIKGWQEKIDAAQRLPLLEINGKTYPRVRYGREREDWGAEQRPCHDCAVLKGQLHVDGCDVERCPVCHGQRITCECGGTVIAPAADATCAMCGQIMALRDGEEPTKYCDHCAQDLVAGLAPPGEDDWRARAFHCIAMERHRAQTACLLLREALGQATPLPAPDVLEILADAVDHLLREHCCDHQQHEAWATAADRARAMVPDLRTGMIAASTF